MRMVRYMCEDLLKDDIIECSILEREERERERESERERERERISIQVYLLQLVDLNGN